jgi:hypothetical protein
MKKKKVTKISIKTIPLSNVFDIKNGKRRGWGVLR